MRRWVTGRPMGPPISGPTVGPGPPLRSRVKPIRLPGIKGHQCRIGYTCHSGLLCVFFYGWLRCLAALWSMFFRLGISPLMYGFRLGEGGNWWGAPIVSGQLRFAWKFVKLPMGGNRKLCTVEGRRFPPPMFRSSLPEWTWIQVKNKLLERDLGRILRTINNLAWEDFWKIGISLGNRGVESME